MKYLDDMLHEGVLHRRGLSSSLCLPGVSAQPAQQPALDASPLLPPATSATSKESSPRAALPHLPTAHSPMSQVRKSLPAPHVPSQGRSSKLLLPALDAVVGADGVKVLATLAETLTSTAEYNRYTGQHTADDDRSVFECVTIPPITVWRFVEVLCGMVPITSVEHWYITACLVDRLCISSATPLTPWNQHRILLVCFAIALPEQYRRKYLPLIAAAGGVTDSDMDEMIATFHKWGIPEGLSTRQHKKVALSLATPTPVCSRLLNFDAARLQVATLLGQSSVMSSTRLRMMKAKRFSEDLSVSTEQTCAQATSEEYTGSSNSRGTASIGEGTSTRSSPVTLMCKAMSPLAMDRGGKLPPVRSPCTSHHQAEKTDPTKASGKSHVSESSSRE